MFSRIHEKSRDAGGTRNGDRRTRVKLEGNRSTIPRYRKVVVFGIHTAENHDFSVSEGLLEPMKKRDYPKYCVNLQAGVEKEISVWRFMSMSRRNRTPAEKARRAKIRELQEYNIESAADI